MQLKHTNNLKLLNQVRHKKIRTQREARTAQSIRDELSTLGDDGRVYKSVGKCFVLSTVQHEVKDAEQKIQTCKDEEVMFDKQHKFLTDSVRANEKAIGEIMRATNNGTKRV